MDAVVYLLRDAGLIGFLLRHKESEAYLRRQLLEPKTASQIRMWRTRHEYLPGILRLLKLRLGNYKIRREYERGFWIRADAQKVLAIADPLIREFKIHGFHRFGFSNTFTHIAMEYKFGVLQDLRGSKIATYCRELYFHPDYPEHHCLKPDLDRIQVYQFHHWTTKGLKNFVADIVCAMQMILMQDYHELKNNNNPSVCMNDAEIKNRLYDLWDMDSAIHQSTYLAIFDMLREIAATKNAQ